MFSREEEEDGLDELKDEVNASTIGDDSIAEEEEREGPNMSLSFNSDGVKAIGIETSLFSGRGKRGGGGGVLFLGLTYGSKGSFSI